jgi:hypothetical protein
MTLIEFNQLAINTVVVESGVFITLPGVDGKCARGQPKERDCLAEGGV